MFLPAFDALSHATVRVCCIHYSQVKAQNHKDVAVAHGGCCQVEDSASCVVDSVVDSVVDRTIRQWPIAFQLGNADDKSVVFEVRSGNTSRLFAIGADGRERNALDLCNHGATRVQGRAAFFAQDDFAFVSDRSGSLAIWRCDLRRQEVRQLTWPAEDESDYGPAAPGNDLSQFLFLTTTFPTMHIHFRSAVAGFMIATIVSMTGAIASQDVPPSHDHQAMSGAVPPALLPVSTAHSFSALMANVDDVMHHGMANAKRNGDPDHDFASAMIPHHQGAVDMAKVELLYGKDPVLRRLAQEIIVSQQQEIAVMQRQIDAMPTTPLITSPKAP